MRIRALKSGRVVVNVKVNAPKTVVPSGYRGVYTDSANVEIFENLRITDYKSQPLLLASNIKYQLKTNKDKVIFQKTTCVIFHTLVNFYTCNFLHT